MKGVVQGRGRRGGSQAQFTGHKNDKSWMTNHEYYNFIFTYPNNQHVKHSLIFFLSKEKGSKEVSENTSARGPQGKERLQIASYTLSSSNYHPYCLCKSVSTLPHLLQPLLHLQMYCLHRNNIFMWHRSNSTHSKWNRLHCGWTNVSFRLVRCLVHRTC